MAVMKLEQGSASPLQKKQVHSAAFVILCFRLLSKTTLIHHVKQAHVEIIDSFCFPVVHK
jgi:hypothetical protein